MTAPDPPPEVTMIRVAEVALRVLEHELDADSAMGEIIGVLEIGGVPWPKSKQEAAAIRAGYSFRPPDAPAD